MGDNGKRKGPPLRAGLYVAAGIAIGLVAAFGAMLVLVTPSLTPDPTATLPGIPTPDATGTVGAVRADALPVTYMSDFVVDEDRQAIAMLYTGQDHDTTLEVRSWSESRIGSTINVLAHERGFGYSYVDFHPYKNQVIASVRLNASSSLFSIDNLRRPFIKYGNFTIAYSENGQWRIDWGEEFKLYDETNDQLIKQTSFENFGAADVVFSPDSTKVAVLGRDKSRSNKFYIEIYSVPDLALLDVYELIDDGETDNYDPELIFTETMMVAVLRLNIYKIDFNTSQMQYFQLPYEYTDIDVDDTGQWLAVSVYNQRFIQSQLLLYDLNVNDTLSLNTTTPIVLTELTASRGINIQFVSSGLLIATDDLTFTLYRWTGETWGDPQVIFTAADLE